MIARKQSKSKQRYYLQTVSKFMNLVNTNMAINKLTVQKKIGKKLQKKF